MPPAPPRRLRRRAAGARASRAAVAGVAAARARESPPKPPSASPPTAIAAPPLPDEVEMFWLTDWSVGVVRASISSVEVTATAARGPPPPPSLALMMSEVVEPGLVLADAGVDRVVVGRVVDELSWNESLPGTSR